ncbi:MAG: amino acid permease, partial [Phycicoccus sp.]|nr:amino acid permease [Phycicoccus sp.]
AVPYAFSALAQITWRLHDNQAARTPRFALDLSVAIVAFVLSLAFIYYSRNSGDSWYVVWGPFLMAGGASLLGIPVYLAQRKQMTEPLETPAYR